MRVSRSVQRATIAALQIAALVTCVAIPARDATASERWSLYRGRDPLVFSTATETIDRARAALRSHQLSARQDGVAYDRRAAQPLWLDLIVALFAGLKVPSTSAGAADDLAVETRNAIIQLDDPAERVALLEDLARIELSKGRVASAEKAHSMSWRSVLEVSSPAVQDALKRRAASLGALLSPAARAEARERAATIGDIAQRIAALRELAGADVADGSAGAEAQMLFQAGDAPELRDARLLALAERFLLVGFSDLATTLTLATEAVPTERDRMLARIVEREIVWRVQPPRLFAHRLIFDSRLAAAVARRVVAYELASRELAAARQTALGIEVAGERWAALLDIAAWLGAERYGTQAEGLLDLVDRETSAAGVSALRPALEAQRFALLLQREDAGAAVKLWRSGASSVPEVRARIGEFARLLLQAERSRDLDRLADETMDADEAALVGYELARAALRDRAYARAAGYIERIADADARVRANLELARDRVLWADPRAEVGVRDAMVRRAEAALVAGARTSSTDEELHVLLVDTLAALGRYDLALQAVQRLSPERQRRLDVQGMLAVAAARSGDVMASLQRIEAFPPSGSRARVVRDVAEVLMEQGHVREATALVRAIPTWADRAKGFSLLARRHGELVLASGALTGSADGIPPGPAVPDRPDALVAKQRAPLYSRGSISFFGSDDPGEKLRLPDLPDLRGADAASIRAAVPAIAPGRMHVTFLQYSQYNKKFMADVGKVDLARDAQGSRHPRYIFLETGVFDLPAIYDRLRDSDEDQILTREGRKYLVRMPVLVGPEASLVISGNDVESFRLSKEGSSYLVNAGKLFIVDTELMSWSEKSGELARLSYETRQDYRPFFLAWSGSETLVTQSRIAGLGYQSDKSYGMSFSAGPADLLRGFGSRLARPTGTITDSIFDQMLYGYYSYEADDMRVVGNTYENSVVYGVDPHDRSNGLVFAYNTAYGTEVAHGLIGSREVDSAWWIGNVSFDNAGSGLMIDRDSVSNLIFGNLLFDNRQDGLTFFESSCALVVGNEIFGNDRNGALVRNSWSISLFRNRVTGNSINAVTAYAGTLDQPQRDYALDPYFPVTSLTVADNLLAGRQSLMNLKSLSAVTLGKNRFLGARLISGMDRKVERDLVGLSGRGVTITDQCAPSIPAVDCGLEEAGFVKPVRHFVEPLAGEACGAGGARAHAAVEQDEAKR